MTLVFEASVTSRREISRRDVILIFLCHVATCIFTSRRQNISYLSRRDVGFYVATSFGHALCHVATWDFTSRRHLVMSSVTSRRGISRRDVGLFVLCHVATWPRTSRRGVGFNPKIGHFWPFTAPSSSRNPSLLCTPALTGSSEPLPTPVGDIPLARRPL